MTDEEDAEALRIIQGESAPEPALPPAPTPVATHSVVPVASDNEQFEVMDKRDEDQIIEELKGAIIEEYVYQFERKVKGKKEIVTALSWAGVKETARRMKNIEISGIDIVETDIKWRMLCRAVDKERNFTMFGGAEQLKMTELDDGRKIPDKFAFAKCLSKCQRNGLRNIIPESFVKEIIAKYLEERKCGQRVSIAKK